MIATLDFGNALIWCGFYLLALSAGGWWTVVSPLLMTFLLLKVSGVVLLEQDISDRRPAYRAYIQPSVPTPFSRFRRRRRNRANHPREVRL